MRSKRKRNLGVLIVAFFTVLALAFGGLFFLIMTAITAASCIPQYAVYTLIQTIPNPLKLLTIGSSAASYFNQFKPADAAQRRAIADLIVRIGHQRKDSDESIAIALATAIQESGLRNLPYGDADSLGIYQQRPSVMDRKGNPTWGTAEQILNPSYAINRFYQSLETVPDRDRRPMIDVAIQIQGPSKAAYHATWKWDDIAKNIVSESGQTASTSVCFGNANATSAVSSQGWQLPLDRGYKKGDPFGFRINPFTHVRAFHEGQDLNGVPKGVPIYAVHDGTVLTASWSGGYGNFVLLDHGGGIKSAYGHMSAFGTGLKVGDTVKEGQVIGFLGSTGNSTGAHLHFEIRINNKATDPDPFMTEHGANLFP